LCYSPFLPLFHEQFCLSTRVTWHQSLSELWLWQSPQQALLVNNSDAFSIPTSTTIVLLLLVFCCSSRSMTPITETHHRHLSSARFFAVSYPSHMLLISCSLFLPLVRFPVILPSRTSRNNTSCRRTCPSHLRFR